MNKIKNNSVAINWFLLAKCIYRVSVLSSVLNEKKYGALPVDETDLHNDFVHELIFSSSVLE